MSTEVPSRDLVAQMELDKLGAVTVDEKVGLKQNRVLEKHNRAKASIMIVLTARSIFFVELACH